MNPCYSYIQKYDSDNTKHLRNHESTGIYEKNYMLDCPCRLCKIYVTDVNFIDFFCLYLYSLEQVNIAESGLVS